MSGEAWIIATLAEMMRESTEWCDSVYWPWWSRETPARPVMPSESLVNDLLRGMDSAPQPGGKS